MKNMKSCPTIAIAISLCTFPNYDGRKRPTSFFCCLALFYTMVNIPGPLCAVVRRRVWKNSDVSKEELSDGNRVHTTCKIGLLKFQRLHSTIARINSEIPDLYKASYRRSVSSTMVDSTTKGHRLPLIFARFALRVSASAFWPAFARALILCCDRSSGLAFIIDPGAGLPDIGATRSIVAPRTRACSCWHAHLIGNLYSGKV